MSQSKEWPTSKLWPTGCWLHNWNEMAHGPPHPAWCCCNEGTIFPQETSEKLGTIQWYGLKRQWHWPKLSKGTLSILGCLQGVLCGAVQELHECLASMIQSSNLLDLEMLDVAEKDPVAPTSEGRAPCQCPGGPTGQCNCPSQLNESEQHCPRNSPLCQDRDCQPWLLPPVGRWVSLTLTGAGRLAHEHTPGSPTGFCLLWVHKGDYIIFSSDR